MERRVLLRHLRAACFAFGDRGRARPDARRIARFLGRCGARKCGRHRLPFDPRRPFTDRSDIDLLVVEGIDPGSFYIGDPGPAPRRRRTRRRAVELEEVLARRLAAEIESEKEIIPDG